MKKTESLLLTLVMIFSLLCNPMMVNAAGKNENVKKIVLYTGQKKTITNGILKKKAVWKVTKKKIANIYKNGKIKGNKKGKTTVYAKYKGKTYKWKVTVKDPYFQEKDALLKVGETKQLKLIGTKIKSCKSTNKKVVSVTNKGKVKAILPGEAQIKVTGKNKKTYKCKVTVITKEKEAENTILPIQDQKTTGQTETTKNQVTTGSPVVTEDTEEGKEEVSTQEVTTTQDFPTTQESTTTQNPVTTQNPTTTQAPTTTEKVTTQAPKEAAEWKIEDGVLVIRIKETTAKEDIREVIKDNTNDTITKIRMEGVADSNLSSLFSGFNNVTDIDLSTLDTKNVTNMYRMFDMCTNLKNLNLSGVDTSKVENMMGMFQSCQNLESLDISSFNTSKTKNMSCMFDKCLNLKKLSFDVENFVTDNVNDLSYMFYNCNSLENLDVSHFNTSNVKDMRWMFSRCSSLENLDVSQFDTSNVTDMFLDCPKEIIPDWYKN